MSHKWEHTPYPKTCQMLEAWGIDPRWVSRDNPPDESGYYEMRHTSDGKKIYDTIKQETVLDHREWPEDCNVALILKTFEKERYIAK